jgi:DNA-binding transcriptional LysR family regulator
MASTLDQWRAFCAVMENGSYVKAAVSLNRSHSALNHAVRKLEDQIGLRLLQPKGRNVVPTEAGRVMARRARHLLEDAEQFENLARTIGQGWESRIRLVVEIVFPRGLISTALNKFAPESQGTTVQIEDAVLFGAVEAIENQQAQLVISPIVPSGKLGHHLIQVGLVPVAVPEHPLCLETSPVTQAALALALQISIADTSSQPDKQEVGWLRAQQRWSTPNFEAARNLVLHGTGFSWLPLWLVQDDLDAGRLGRITLSDIPTRQIPLYLVSQPLETLGPATRRLREILLETVAEGT